ncbi:SH3 domain-containing protein [Bacillus sp. T3]|uniref:SH3 domain-containing protein n=1 Tax=Bacillus sp. T3 TaxID=467262 RepID=UPI0029811587|nr:SH3 domain-containing protein [Bacillus sp. T3]
MDVCLKGGHCSEKKIHISLLIIIVLLVSGLLPVGKTTANSSSVIINENQTNIREGPGLSYKKIRQASKGDRFPVLKESGDWIQIQLNNNEKGWVANWLVTYEQTQTSSSKLAKGKTISITGDNVRVRSGPGTKYKVLDSVNLGQTGEVKELNGDWVKITYSGNTGWVSSNFVELSQKEENNQSQKESTSTKTDKATGTVTATSLIVRKKGALDGDIIGKVYQGDKFVILDEVNNWMKIEYKSGSYGWVASWYMEKSVTKTNDSVSKTGTVKILFDGTNIRKKPSVQSDVVKRANEGDTFKIVKVTNDWYEISLENGDSAYVAGWLVQDLNSSQQIEKSGSEIHLKNKTIVVDPGHGGKDQGTEGYKGTQEKNVTIKTALLLSNKLKAAGANVILTRSNDSFLSLSSRVRLSHYHSADAFISIHYDSINDTSVRGTTSFYNHPFQKPLASSLHSAIVQSTGLKDRGVRFGDYHVLRENKRNATLLELGYLSNPTEENLITTDAFQEKAATGIYKGLVKYFTN